METLRIKWGKIFGYVVGMFFIYCIIKHKVVNGIDNQSMFYELVIYGTLDYVVAWALEGIRKDFLKAK